MFSIVTVCGHIQVYDQSGKFLFSADTIREVREEISSYEEYTA